MKLVTLIVILFSINIFATAPTATNERSQRVNLQINRHFELQLRSYGFVFDFSDSTDRKEALNTYLKSLTDALTSKLKFHRKKEIALAYSQYLTTIIQGEDLGDQEIAENIEKAFKASVSILLNNQSLEDEVFEIAANLSYLYGLIINDEKIEKIKVGILKLNPIHETQRRAAKSYLAALSATQKDELTTFVLNQLETFDIDYKSHFLFFSANEVALEYALSNSEEIDTVSFHKIITYACEARRSKKIQGLCSLSYDQLIESAPKLYQFTYLNALVASCTNTTIEVKARCSQDLEIIIQEKLSTSQGIGSLIYADLEKKIKLLASTKKLFSF